MVTALNLKNIIDLPRWRICSQPITTTSVSYGLISDFRNNEDRNPYIYFIGSITEVIAYNTKINEWLRINGAIPSGQFSSGFFMSGQGPRSNIVAGSTSTNISISFGALAKNQLANRGDGRGYKIRIIGNAAGSSGKTEERYIVANTVGGGTMKITLDNPLSFTPIAGDNYELLSGYIFILGGTPTGASGFIRYDPISGVPSNRSTTNLGVNLTGSNLVGLDEQLVPYDRQPGEGFLGAMIATGSSGTTFIGQASGGDAGLVANQYRNFQIRIIEDRSKPTAAGQRRNITSHTAGPSPIYTIPAWTTTPSTNAKYVIENNGDRILAFFGSRATTYTYSISANTWSTATFAGRGGNAGPAVTSQQAFAIKPDMANPSNTRHSHIFSFRGGSTILDLLDIAGATTGLWTNSITYGNAANILFSAQASCVPDPATNQGRYMYLDTGGNVSPTSQRILRFDMKNRIIEQAAFLRIPVIQTTTTTSPKRLGYTVFVDGSTKLSFIFYNVQNAAGNQQFMFSLPIIEQQNRK